MVRKLMLMAVMCGGAAMQAADWRAGDYPPLILFGGDPYELAPEWKKFREALELNDIKRLPNLTDKYEDKTLLQIAREVHERFTKIVNYFWFINNSGRTGEAPNLPHVKDATERGDLKRLINFFTKPNFKLTQARIANPIYQLAESIKSRSGYMIKNLEGMILNDAIERGDVAKVREILTVMEPQEIEAYQRKRARALLKASEDQMKNLEVAIKLLQ
jgi:hypothetical protein